MSINFYLPRPILSSCEENGIESKLNLIEMDIGPKQIVYGLIFLCLLSGFGFQVFLSVFWYNINVLRMWSFFRWRKAFENSSKAKQQLQSICNMLNYFNCQRLAFVQGSKMEGWNQFENQEKIWPFCHTLIQIMSNQVRFKEQKFN